MAWLLYVPVLYFVVAEGGAIQGAFQRGMGDRNSQLCVSTRLESWRAHEQKIVRICN
jgi:hypothetical protein